MVERRPLNKVTKFKKGDPRPEGSGRIKGQPNRHTKLLKDALIMAAEIVGEEYYQAYRQQTLEENRRALNENDKELPPPRPSHGDLVEFLAHAARTDLKAFLPALTKVLPMQIKTDEGEIEVVYRTRKEVEAALRARGLPIVQQVFRLQHHHTDGNGNVVDLDGIVVKDG